MWGADANVPASRSHCTQQCLTNATHITFFLQGKNKAINIVTSGIASTTYNNDLKFIQFDRTFII